MDYGISESESGIPDKLGKLLAGDSLALLLFNYTNLKDINASTNANVKSCWTKLKWWMDIWRISLQKEGYGPRNF